MPDTHRSRIVADRKVVEILASELDSEEEVRARLEHYGDDPIRITDVDFALTHRHVAVALPPLLGGQYDARTELVAKHDRARQWGRDLFEHVWEEAVPLEEHVLDTHLLFWRT